MRWFSPRGYGMRRYVDIFTSRQLVALTTLSDLVAEARDKAPGVGQQRRGSIGEHEEYFIVRDASGQALGYFHFDEEPQRRSATKRWRLGAWAVNFARLPALLKKTS